jgi:hypothetical protein
LTNKGSPFFCTFSRYRSEVRGLSAEGEWIEVHDAAGIRQIAGTNKQYAAYPQGRVVPAQSTDAGCHTWCKRIGFVRAAAGDK